MTPFHNSQTQVRQKASSVLGLPAVHSVQANVFRELRQREEVRAKRYILTTPKRPLRERVAHYLFVLSRNGMERPHPAIQ